MIDSSRSSSISILKGDNIDNNDNNNTNTTTTNTNKETIRQSITSPISVQRPSISTEFVTPINLSSPNNTIFTSPKNYNECSDTIINELWTIFSFYAVHGDSNEPEVIKTATYVKFARDTQIVSKKLTVTMIELEIAKVAREKKWGSYRTDDGGYSASINLRFKDFISLLDVFAAKIYPNASPNISLRRLLLENVFLLGCHRLPPYPFPNDTEINDQEARKFIFKKFSKSLQSIFNYYLVKAQARRSKRLRDESSLVIRKNIYSPPSPLAETLKEEIRNQRYHIGYQEFVNFCQDFNLKSTSLLTAIQVADVYLHWVKLNGETLSLNGMDYVAFLNSILNLAIVAYRDSKVSTVNKLKAFMLFMWKTLNNTEKLSEIIKNRQIPVSYSGNMNLFGSGPFADQFLTLWQKEGFPQYSLPSDQIDSKQNIKKLLSSITFDDDDTTINNYQNNDMNNISNNNEKDDNHAITIYGADLAALFKLKPELSELIYLEILNMQKK